MGRLVCAPYRSLRFAQDVALSDDESLHWACRLTVVRSCMMAVLKSQERLGGCLGWFPRDACRARNWGHLLPRLLLLFLCMILKETVGIIISPDVGVHGLHEYPLSLFILSYPCICSVCLQTCKTSAESFLSLSDVRPIGLRTLILFLCHRLLWLYDSIWQRRIK